MVRILLVLCLIASLLWCPINCMAGPQEDEARPTPKTGCPCCQKHGGEKTEAPAPESHNRPVPVEEGDCGSCLCHGAVRSDDDQLIRLAFEIALFPEPFLAGESVSDLGLNLTASYPPSHRKLVRSGFAVRLLRRSFLL